MLFLDEEIILNSGQDDVGINKFQAIRRMFPFSLDRLLNLDEFDIIGRQLSLEGYKDWEIVEAGCMIIAQHRINILDKELSPKEMSDSLKKYIENYVETEDSPFPSAEAFTLKIVRTQVITDRITRMTRSETLRPPIGTPIKIEDVAENRVPENCLYNKTKDGYHLWKIVFPKFDWEINIGCGTDDSEAFIFSEELANDLAKYVNMIDWWLTQLETCRKDTLNISVFEEKFYKRFHPQMYENAIEESHDLSKIPIITSWRDESENPHMQLVVTDSINKQSRSRRLYYAFCGILDCIGGLEKPQAAKKAAELLKTLE